jgi:16S rRNA (guanine966-N2)-methyltransferase
MRVVAGSLGGRRLVSPDGTVTRPTTDRVREAVFNALGSAGVIDGAVVADLYAGSGAVGIEALSRGAATCTFVERDRAALAALDANVAALGIAARSTIRRGDVLAHLPSIDADLAFADPPYGFDDWERLLAAVRADLVVAESGRAVGDVDGWIVTRAKRYGRTWVTFLERAV